jgi:hypothetical protein
LRKIYIVVFPGWTANPVLASAFSDFVYHEDRRKRCYSGESVLISHFGCWPKVDKLLCSYLTEFTWGLMMAFEGIGNNSDRAFQAKVENFSPTPT